MSRIASPRFWQEVIDRKSTLQRKRVDPEATAIAVTSLRVDKDTAFQESRTTGVVVWIGSLLTIKGKPSLKTRISALTAAGHGLIFLPVHALDDPLETASKNVTWALAHATGSLQLLALWNRLDNGKACKAALLARWRTGTHDLTFVEAPPSEEQSIHRFDAAVIADARREHDVCARADEDEHIEIARDARDDADVHATDDGGYIRTLEASQRFHIGEPEK